MRAGLELQTLIVAFMEGSLSASGFRLWHSGLFWSNASKQLNAAERSMIFAIEGACQTFQINHLTTDWLRERVASEMARLACDEQANEEQGLAK